MKNTIVTKIVFLCGVLACVGSFSLLSTVHAADDKKVAKFMRDGNDITDGYTISTGVLTTRNEAVSGCISSIYDISSGTNEQTCTWGDEILYRYQPTIKLTTTGSSIYGGPIRYQGNVVRKFEMSVDGNPRMLMYTTSDIATAYCVPPASNRNAFLKCVYEGKTFVEGTADTIKPEMTISADKEAVQYGDDVTVKWTIKNATQCYVENTLVEPKQINAVNYYDYSSGGSNAKRYTKVTAPLTVTLRCTDFQGQSQSKSVTVQLAKVTDPIPPVTSDYLCVNITKDITFNTTADEVYSLGAYLYAKGYMETNPRTRTLNQDIITGITKFQSIQNISENGAIGPQTRERLKALSCTKKMSMPAPGTYKSLVGEDVFPSVIGTYERKNEKMSVEKCDIENCMLSTRATYTNGTETFSIDAQQYVTDSKKSIDALEKEITQLKSYGAYSGNVCFLISGLVCVTQDRKVVVSISSQTYLLSPDEYQIYKNNSRSLSDLPAKQQAYIASSSFIKTILDKMSIPLGEWTMSSTTKKMYSDYYAEQSYSSGDSRCVTLTKSLAAGQENSEVLALQQFLYARGYMSVKPNGYFGPGTVAALKKFQRAYGMAAVGSVGPGTRTKIKSLSCSSSSRTTSDQPSDIRNASRNSAVNTILNAVTQYAVDNNGILPTGITTTPTEICATGTTSCSGMVNLSVLSDNGKYVTAIPRDPQVTSTKGTAYVISKNNSGRITVSALYAEGGKVISVTR
jgi:peptidoglycan hydrolase-like protein with peptidoglycan-binding domain